MHTYTQVDAPAVKDLSTAAAENNPNKVAFGNGIDGNAVTWTEFDSQSIQAANALRTHIGQGDRVAFFCEGSVEHVTLWNGALKAGAVVSNLHVRASPKTVWDCINEIRPRVIVIDEEFSEFFQEEIYEELTTALDAVITIGEPQAEYEEPAESYFSTQNEDEPDVRVRENDIAAIVWTSGTTGMPKGWCFTNRALIKRGMKILGSLQSSRQSRRIQGLTPSFAAWYSGTVPALLENSSTFFQRTWDPEAYLRLIEAREITKLTLVPTMWHELLRLDNFDDYDISSLENISASGERLDVDTLEKLREEVCESVTNGYAATEAFGTTMLDSELDGEKIESVGKPVPGTRIRIVEPGGTLTDRKNTGETGEIIIKADDCPSWAWGQTETTEQAFRNEWWFSGDLGYKDDDGFLYLEGRKDFVIKSKGIKIHPSPIEERLNAHPDVEEAAVIGLEDKEYGEKVTAIVTPSDIDLTEEELDEWCLDADEIAQFERPREYRFYDGSLPKTVTGKLDRKAMTELED